MITVKKRELTRSATDPIQMWLAEDAAFKFRSVLAGRIAELEAEFVNESLRWSTKLVSGEVPQSAQSKLSLATRYQIALDVLNEMGQADAPMSHVTLELPYA